MAVDEVSDTMPCAICGRPVDPRFKPFCSRRCSDVDLANWLGGRYAIPVPEDERSDIPGQDDEA